MRDTFRLRARLAQLASLSALWVGCDDTSSGAQRPDPTAAATADAAPVRDDPKPQSSASERPVPAAPDVATPTRFDPIAGDPPFIDGYNPEEEPCPSGNWCGSIEAAVAITSDGTPRDDATTCPMRITGALDPNPIQGKAYEGLSSAQAMQGAFNAHGTDLARAAQANPPNGQSCCYHWFEYCSGRPYVGEDGPTRADLAAPIPQVAPNTLMAGVRGSFVDVSTLVRERIAAAWISDALDEHASVAAFSRTSLELMEVGAPLELLAGVHRAAMDEVEHTRLCLDIAASVLGQPVPLPGPLRALPARPANALRLAFDTLFEACVGETIAALTATRAATGTTVETIRASLTKIADDETRHAALGWRTLAWLIETQGEHIWHALWARAIEATPSSELDRDDTRDRDVEQLDHWRDAGRLAAGQRRLVTQDAWAEIILPMLASLRPEARRLGVPGTPTTWSPQAAPA